MSLRNNLIAAATASVVALVLGAAASAATVASYNLAGLPGSGTPPASATPTTATGITGLDLVRGAGINAAVLANGFSADNWNTFAGSVSTAIADNEYFQFGFSVDSNYTASLTTMDFSLRRSATDGPMNYELQASADGFATPGTTVATFMYLGRNSGTAPGTLTPFQWMTTDTPGQGNGNPISPIDLTATPLLQNIAGGTTITFRLFAWGNGGGAALSNTVALGRSTAANGNGVGGPLIQGDVVLIPEPAAGTLMGCVLLAAAAFVRRRD